MFNIVRNDVFIIPFYLFFFISIGCFLWASILHKKARLNFVLVVTNQRVYGEVKKVRTELFLNQITAVEMGKKKSIGVRTAGGIIWFPFCENQLEVFNTISSLLREQQNKKSETSSTAVNQTSNADELKKYKDLLDSGVITQEEFDTKKKQLLGL